MASLTMKTIHLLLLVTLVMQPVAVVHAMSEAGHGHHHHMAATHHGHGGDMAMADGQDMADPPSYLDDCCDSAACAPAALFDAFATSAAPVPQHFLPLVLHWAGIDLPTEVEPPRSLLG